jgi:hypothetical protein
VFASSFIRVCASVRTYNSSSGSALVESSFVAMIKRAFRSISCSNACWSRLSACSDLPKSHVTFWTLGRGASCFRVARLDFLTSSPLGATLAPGFLSFSPLSFCVELATKRLSAHRPVPFLPGLMVLVRPLLKRFSGCFYILLRSDHHESVLLLVEAFAGC